MDRRSFIRTSSLIGAGLYWSSQTELLAASLSNEKRDLYALFKNPSSHYHPFVRWWWNGDKVEQTEINRQLHLLKEAGIGGVEINPIAFPQRADDLGIKSVKWLSDEWIDLVKYAAVQAENLDMTSDLIVGSGWPFGSEDLKEEERAQVTLVYAKNIRGPISFETSKFNIYNEVDPGVTDKNPLRLPELLSLHLAKDPMNSIADAVDLSHKKEDEIIHVEVPEGDHVLYALVKFTSFAQVINGAPGASGSILNHMDKQAVENYLNKMSKTIEGRIGSLSNYLRALFSDSMELEGSNWTHDFAAEFQKRCGYDLMPYLPFIMFRVGRLGAVVDHNYGAQKSEEFKKALNRIRFDFEFVKASLLKERFTETYLAWCKRLKVKSRAQPYGRGFFPLETSLNYDIPEGESWTTNYLRHKLGKEMSDQDYRRGRGYTMINKYVSSAAHLTGKRLVSCEEMTNTYLVFNATLELLKLGSDQSIMSGITHSIWHGFNYSPKEAPFPGWIQYGSYYSEKNNWWPYFKLLNTYKARLSSQIQHADQYTDIAILPANYDLWAELGVQTDPFPERLNVPYTSLIWEAISKTGGAADYVTDIILAQSSVEKGKLIYGKKSYGLLFLPRVESISEEAFLKIEEFVRTGGKVFCIETYPNKGLGFKNWTQKDQQIQQIVTNLKKYSDRFILLDKPADNRFLEWYVDLLTKYDLPRYMKISKPDRFFMQVRYIRDDGSELYFFQNAHRFQSHEVNIVFEAKQLKDKQAWVWDLDSGERYKLNLHKDYSLTHDFGPTESLMIVFDNHKDKQGQLWRPLPTKGGSKIDLTANWQVRLVHSIEKYEETIHLDRLIDMKDSEKMVNFTGTAIYTKKVSCNFEGDCFLNLGEVQGITKLVVNKADVGTKWYGRRIFNVKDYILSGENEIEIHVVTTMGNYLKTLTDNENAQYWVNRKGREQEIQSMGIIGPVEIYES